MFPFLKKDQNRFCEVWVLKTTKPPAHQMLSEELRSHRSVWDSEETEAVSYLQVLKWWNAATTK